MDEDAQACRNMWCAVIREVISDIFEPLPKNEKSERHYKAEKNRGAAKRWVFWPQHDAQYRMVCELAGINPDRLRDEILRMVTVAA